MQECSGGSGGSGVMNEDSQSTVLWSFELSNPAHPFSEPPSMIGWGVTHPSNGRPPHSGLVRRV
jgi:hypothetical protein